MLQLPHMDTDVVKRLGRKGVRSITDLQQLGEEKMLEYLIAAGHPPPPLFSPTV